MPNEPTDYAEEIAALIDGRYRRDNGVAWLERLTRRVVDDSAPAAATVMSARTVGRDGWHVSVTVGDQPLALIDIYVAGGGKAIDATTAMSELDRVLVKAVEQWRSVTRTSEIGNVRPWLGCVWIEERSSADETGDRALESLPQMVNERNLDAACLVRIDPQTRSVTYPNPAMSLQGFAASLIGRCRSWTALAK